MGAMPRWEPHARERLVAAALQLFTEQGYDETTVEQVAQRAGLTKSTFFRHFPDKRDVLAAGQETLSRLLVEGITAAPADATPVAAVALGLQRVAGSMTELNRVMAPSVQAAIASSAELQARDQLKQVGMAAAMTAALRDRGVAPRAATLAAELGTLAFREAFAAWVVPDNVTPLPTLTADALAGLQAALRELT
jgi:AcrR family transcriptional regulator